MLPVIEIVLPGANSQSQLGGNVPAFLAKLWKMVDNPDTGNKLQTISDSNISSHNIIQTVSYPGLTAGTPSSSRTSLSLRSRCCRITTNTQTWPLSSVSSTCTDSTKL